jgi:DNA-binding MarR family transcriptional regulator
MNSEKRYAALCHAGDVVHEIFGAHVDQIYNGENGDSLAILDIFATKPRLTAKEFSEELEWPEDDVTEFLDEMCTAGMLAKAAATYAVTPKLQKHFDTLAAKSREALEVIFKGLSDADAKALDAILEKVTGNCEAFMEKHPELFAIEDECDCDNCSCCDDDDDEEDEEA